MDSVSRNTEMVAPVARRGRPRAFNRDKALRAALDVFWNRGFDGAQLAELNGAMGINPPSFYAAFQSKELLFREVVSLYIEMQESRMGRFFEPGLPARDAIRGVMETSADIALSAPGARGCMLILGVTNALPSNAALRELLLDRRTESRGRLRRILARGIADGELSQSADTDGLARFFAATVQGISLQARDGASRTELQAIIDAAIGALDPHTIVS